jgi:predicted nucleic acid-binding protein
VAEASQAHGLVKLVVDANIVFSALLTTRGEVSKLLASGWPPLELFAPEALSVEIALHREKLMRLSKLSVAEMAIIETGVFDRITVVPHESIGPEHWERAYDLVKAVDERDDHYVALALHLNCPLWTGDKKLVNGLRRKNFKLLVTTEELRKKLGA